MQDPFACFSIPCPSIHIGGLFFCCDVKDANATQKFTSHLRCNDISISLLFKVGYNINMIKIIAIGKLKEKHLLSLCNEYVKRMQPYHKLEVIEVKDENLSNLSSKEEDLVKEKEAQEALKKIKDGEFVILLDLHGKSIDSESFAKLIDDTLTYKTSNITFVIGGSLGIGQSLYQRADYRLQLSKMTFLHQMTRLILLEQIYRAFKIRAKETYHK